MELTSNYKKRIIEEIRFVIEKMKAEETLERKTYYFSGIPASLNRYFNLEFRDDLFYFWSGLQTMYIALNQKIAQIHGEGHIIDLPEDFFSKLYEIFERICEKIPIEEDLEPEFFEMAKLAYITTGNGHYLYQKGMIEI